MPPVIMLSIPGLRRQDLQSLKTLDRLAQQGTVARIQHSFPCVTWPSQCNVLTGKTADQHGVVSNGFFWRDTHQVEMWTAWNETIQQPQLWDTIKAERADLKTAAWFPMLAKGCAADYVCMPAPIHKPDGSEDMWCFTKPQEFYGDLLSELQHFPLHHFWGPLAGIQSTRWIVDSAIKAAREFAPDFWYIYLPHLDYAAQKSGPDSPAAIAALHELDSSLAALVAGFDEVYAGEISWLAISEYVIREVDHVTYPNRQLRDAGLLKIQAMDGREQLDFVASDAWALVDHQFSHVYVRDQNPLVMNQVTELFDGLDGIQMVLPGQQRQYLNMDHPRSGEVILVSEPTSWQAYYWWNNDELAPEFARTVDIHRKPGYDPVELFFDPATKSIPLDATLVKGSHGIPAIDSESQGLFVSNVENLLEHETIADVAIHDVVLKLVLS